jgi:hypothetical protein
MMVQIRVTLEFDLPCSLTKRDYGGINLAKPAILLTFLK